MTMYKKIYGLILVLSLGIGTLAFASYLVFRQIPQSGNLKLVGIEAFHDPEKTLSVNSIEWGIVHPNMTYDKMMYLNNNGTLPVILSYWIESWNPTNTPLYLSFSWNGTDTVLPSNQLVPVLMQLTVFPNATSFEAFSYILTIQGLS